jgi:hypothetical protein
LRIVHFSGHSGGFGSHFGFGFLGWHRRFRSHNDHFTMVKDKVLLPYITLQAFTVAPLTETPRPNCHEKSFQCLQ